MRACGALAQLLPRREVISRRLCFGTGLDRTDHDRRSAHWFVPTVQKDAIASLWFPSLLGPDLFRSGASFAHPETARLRGVSSSFCELAQSKISAATLEIRPPVVRISAYVCVPDLDQSIEFAAVDKRVAELLQRPEVVRGLRRCLLQRARPPPASGVAPLMIHVLRSWTSRLVGANSAAISITRKASFLRPAL
jgi:hypothetical protein